MCQLLSSRDRASPSPLSRLLLDVGFSGFARPLDRYRGIHRVDLLKIMARAC